MTRARISADDRHYGPAEIRDGRLYAKPGEVGIYHFKDSKRWPLPKS